MSAPRRPLLEARTASESLELMKSSELSEWLESSESSELSQWWPTAIAAAHLGALLFWACAGHALLGLEWHLLVLEEMAGSCLFYWTHRLGHVDPADAGPLDSTNRDYSASVRDPAIAEPEAAAAAGTTLAGLARAAARGARAWYDAHVVGHHGVYPASRFRAPVYVQNAADAWDLNTHAYSSVGVLLVVMVGCGRLRADKTIVVAHLAWLLAILVLGLLAENWVHVRTHLSRSSESCERWGWFRCLRRVHKRHHSGQMKQNYAVVAVWTDMVFGTFRLDPPGPEETLVAGS